MRRIVAKQRGSRKESVSNRRSKALEAEWNRIGNMERYNGKNREGHPVDRFQCQAGDFIVKPQNDQTLN